MATAHKTKRRSTGFFLCMCVLRSPLVGGVDALIAARLSLSLSFYPFLALTEPKSSGSIKFALQIDTLWLDRLSSIAYSSLLLSHFEFRPT